MLDLTRKATMGDDEVIRNADAGQLGDIRGGRPPIAAEAVRRLARARCPELSLGDLEMAFSDSRTDNILANIADAVTDAVEVLEARLDHIERGLPGRLQ